MIFFAFIVEPFNEHKLECKLASIFMNKDIKYNFYDYIRFRSLEDKIEEKNFKKFRKNFCKKNFIIL